MIETEVEVLLQKREVEHLCFVQKHYNTLEEELMRALGKDRFVALLGDKRARVRVNITERLSGPNNTYSSISIGTTVEMTCNQSAAAIEEAEELVTKMCLAHQDKHIEPVYRGLLEHLVRLDSTLDEFEKELE